MSLMPASPFVVSGDDMPGNATNQELARRCQG